MRSSCSALDYQFAQWLCIMILSPCTTYRRVRLVSKEKEYSWISLMKFELRFLHTDEEGWSWSKCIAMDSCGHCITHVITHTHSKSGHLQCMNPRPGARVQLNWDVSQSLTIAAYHTGFELADAIIWACAPLSDHSCRQGAQHQKSGQPQIH